MNETKAKVLVVEDNKSNVDMLLGLLKDYDVMVALDGETALDLLARETPDVILLDIVLPGIDGFEVCRRIKDREDRSTIPILFITTQTEEASIIQAFDIGGNDYVTKPFRSKELLARVHTQVEYRRAMGRLRTLAVTDALTGLPNRRAFFADGRRLLNEAQARARPLAALRLEIDNLKQINDQYGHACGDEVLMRVADCLLDQIDIHGLCARLGGAEFALLVALPRERQAATLAEHLRRYLAAVVIETTGGPLSVTVSIGVSPLTAECDSLEALLAQASDRLEAAKRAGRNRVCAEA